MIRVVNNCWRSSNSSHVGDRSYMCTLLAAHQHHVDVHTCAYENAHILQREQRREERRGSRHCCSQIRYDNSVMSSAIVSRPSTN